MPGFYSAGALDPSWLPVSPIINPDDESAAADLFGPDAGFVDANGEPEPAIASRHIGDGGELRSDCDDDVNVDEPVISPPPWVFHLQHNRRPFKLRFTGLPICLIDRGADGACLPSGRTRLTLVCPLTPEKFHSSSRIFATFVIQEMRTS